MSSLLFSSTIHRQSDSEFRFDHKQRPTQMERRTPNEQGSRIYVGGLPPDASQEKLESMFCRFGKVNNTWVARRPPGFAFIYMDDHRDAEEAVSALDGTKFFDYRIRVELAHGKKRDARRTDFGGGYGGRDFRRNDFDGGSRENRGYDSSGDRDYRRNYSSEGRRNRSRSRSPMRGERSPRHESKSPCRRERSPRRESRSRTLSPISSPRNKRRAFTRSRTPTP